MNEAYVGAITRPFDFLGTTGTALHRAVTRTAADCGTRWAGQISEPHTALEGSNPSGATLSCRCTILLNEIEPLMLRGLSSRVHVACALGYGFDGTLCVTATHM